MNIATGRYRHRRRPFSGLGLNIGAGVRASHWLNPVNPAAYRRVTPTVLGRLPAATPSTPAATPIGLS
ncbi:hypothetical protein ACQP00_12935 [Dactylosporangium sp. CS-047395]|uniref:hypothetical protein n=1 Tax=Dactylosporangium sp. CS-047395 TaxID=3239936 RepID=UPI003D8FE38B